MTDLFSAGAVRCIAPASLRARIQDLCDLLSKADWPVTTEPVSVVGAPTTTDVACAADACVVADAAAPTAPPSAGLVPGVVIPPELVVVDLVPTGLSDADGQGLATGHDLGNTEGQRGARRVDGRRQDQKTVSSPFASPNELGSLRWPRRALDVLASFPLAESGGCDVVPLPPRERPPLLVVSDVDSTLIAEEVIEELAQAAGTREEVARITEAAMRGELDFAQSLQQRVGTLVGVPDSVFAEVVARITPRPYTAELVAALHVRGGKFGAVSGGFMEVLTPLAERLELDYWAANTLEVASGALTGHTVGAVVDRAAKARILSDWLSDSTLAFSVALGDGANDLDMFASSDLSIALCAKPAARAGANVVLTTPHLAAVAATLWR